MSRPRHAFVFSREYPPTTVGGTSTVARNLAAGLAVLGWRVTVVSTTAHAAFDLRGRDDDGVTVHRAAVGGVYSEESGLSDQNMRIHRKLFAAGLQLADELGPPDVVFMPDLFCLPEATMFARRYDVALINILLQDFRAITPYDSEGHHVTNGVTADRRHLLHLEGKAVVSSDHTVFISKALSDDITGYYPTNTAPHSIVHLGVDLAEIDAVRADPLDGRLRAELLGVESDTRLLVACGRLVPVKGFDTLLEALRQLRDGASDPPVRLALVGVGPEEAGLRRQAAELGIGEQVTFLGDISRQAALSWLSAADVAVVPSLWESFCYVCAEMMAFARPVVCTAVDALRELVPTAEFGYPVPVSGPSGARILDPGDLSTALRSALGDPDEAGRRGRAARRRVELNFTNERFASRLSDLADSLLKPSHRV